MSLAAGRIILETRELAAGLINAGNPVQVVFTGNATEALNLALKGVLKPGDHIVTSSMEHNSVIRPLQALSSSGVEVTAVPCSTDGFMDPDDVRKAIKKNTRMIALIHASNVTGTIMPVEEVGILARERGLVYLVDAAQTIGYLDIDVQRMNIDLLAFPGHKSLYGPQGTGGLYIREGLSLTPMMEGGTGSGSESLTQPEAMPDRYESGTPNTVGLAGLGAGIKYINEQGLEKIRNHGQELLARLIEGLRQITGVTVYGPGLPGRQVPVVSFNLGTIGSSEVAFLLDRVYDIACRSGLHCAPAAHRTMGTLKSGTVRLSMSYHNTAEEVDQALKAIAEIAAESVR
jgi:cysteine desulfurase family protein